MSVAQHDRLCAEIVAGLKAHKGVAALVADRVYGPGDTVAGRPCVVISKGKEYPGIAGQLMQYTVKAESRADSEQLLGALLVAVQLAINGLKRGEVFQCVLSDTGPFDEEGGVHSRKDSFGVFAKAE